MQPLRPEDLVFRSDAGGEFTTILRRTGKGDELKLLCVIEGYCTEPYDARAFAHVWNVAYSGGVDYGRRCLQEELCDLLGVANASRA